MTIPFSIPYWPKKKEPKLPDTPISEFWIVFTDSKDWVGNFLQPHFSHCYVLTRDKYNWIVLNPERLYLRAEIAPFPALDNLISIIVKPHETVIKLTFMPRHTTKRFGICGMFSCVTLVRYLLGLRIRALTPYGLYKKLISLSIQDKVRFRLFKVEIIKKGI